MEQVLSRNAAIAALVKSPHGDLDAYVAVGAKFAADDPEFFGHLIAWNHLKGQVRDAKLALPVLGTKSTNPELADNGYAHLALASPRDFLRGVEWARKGKHAGSNAKLRAIVGGYLAKRTGTYALAFRATLQHRKALHALHAQYHVKPNDWIERWVFKSEDSGPNLLLRSLAGLSDHEAAAAIVNARIPFLLLPQALGPRLKSVPLVMALIESMSPAELANNSKMLQKLGTDAVPELRSAYREAIGRAAASTKGSSLKLERAAEVIADGETRTLVKAAAEAKVKQLSVEGDWLVVVDVSGSMQHSIGLGAEIGALLAAVAKGKVVLAFTNTAVRVLDATGKTKEQIGFETRMLIAGGGTALGLAINWCLANRFVPDGIAVVSDGADHGFPTLATSYCAAVKTWDKSPSVYLYEVAGETSKMQAQAVQWGFDLQTFNLRNGADYYSLPNLVQTMRTNRFSLADEIFATPLLTLQDVFA